MHHANWKKPDSKEHTLNDSIYMTFLQKGDRSVVPSGVGLTAQEHRTRGGRWPNCSLSYHGRNITVYTCQNLKNFTLKKMNFNVCKLQLNLQNKPNIHTKLEKWLKIKGKTTLPSSNWTWTAVPTLGYPYLRRECKENRNLPWKVNKTNGYNYSFKYTVISGSDFLLMEILPFN